MTDDGAGTNEVFTRWAQTTIVLPPFASRDHRDLWAILSRHSSDDPPVRKQARKAGGGLGAKVKGAAVGEGNTSRVPLGMLVNDAGDNEYLLGWRPGSANVAPTDTA